MRDFLFTEVSATEARPVEVLRVGTFLDSRGRKVTISPADLQAYQANFEAGKAGQDVPIDIDHHKQEAAGWLQRLWVEGQSLWALPDWNELGKRLVGEKVYRYLSATIDVASKVLKAVSLVNFPAIKGMQPVELSEGVRALEYAPTSMGRLKAFAAAVLGDGLAQAVAEEAQAQGQHTMRVADLAEICPGCAETLACMGVVAINLDHWRTHDLAMPGPLRKGLCDWVGNEPGFHTRCTSKMRGASFSPKDVDAFCAWLHKECTGKWPAEAGEPPDGDVSEFVIREEEGEIVLYSSDGSKVLGRFPYGPGQRYTSKEAALEAAKARERAIQFYKHQREGGEQSEAKAGFGEGASGAAPISDEWVIWSVGTAQGEVPQITGDIPPEEVETMELTAEQREALKAEVRAEVLAEMQEREKTLSEMREQVRAEVAADLQAEMQARAALVEFAQGLCGGDHGLSAPVEDVVKALEGLPEEQAEAVKAILQSKVVDFTERGSSRDGKGSKALPEEFKPLLRQWLDSKQPLAEFFAVNADVLPGGAEAFDLTEFAESK